MKYIFAADLHLDPYIWSDRRHIHGDSYRALLYLTQEAIKLKKQGPITIILGGDIFDIKKPSSYTEFICAHSASTLRRAGIEMYAVQGNHDYSSEYPRFSLFGIKNLAGKLTKIGDRTFYGIDYTASVDDLQLKLAAVPECDYLVMHSSFSHLLSFKDKYQVQKEDIPCYVGNVLVGDVHVNSVDEFCGEENTPPQFIFSPGATHPRRKSEFSRGHGFFILDDDARSREKIEWRPIPNRGFYNVDYNGGAVEETFKNLKPTHEDARPVYNVMYDVQHAREVAGFKAKYEDRAFILLDPVRTIEGVETSVTLDTENLPTLKECLYATEDKKECPEGFGLLENILDSPESVKESIESALDKLGAEVTNTK